LLGITPVGFSLWGHLYKDVYAVSPRIIKDLIEGLKAAVTIVDATMLKCVQENAMWCTAICLEVDGGCFEHLL
jgi:hypothetical protein